MNRYLVMMTGYEEIIVFHAWILSLIELENRNPQLVDDYLAYTETTLRNIVVNHSSEHVNKISPQATEGDLTNYTSSIVKRMVSAVVNISNYFKYYLFSGIPKGSGFTMEFVSYNKDNGRLILRKLESILDLGFPDSYEDYEFVLAAGRSLMNGLKEPHHGL